MRLEHRSGRGFLRLPSIPFQSLQPGSWLLAFLPSPPFPLYLCRKEDFIVSAIFSPSYFALLRCFCRATKRRNERRAFTRDRFNVVRKKGNEREAARFASSSDTRFRQPTVDYFYACTQLFIVQRIIRSIRPVRHSHYENSRVPDALAALFFRPAIVAKLSR